MSDQGDRPGAFSPEYGTVQAFVVYGLVYLVVASATDALTDALAAVAPGTSPALLTTAMAGVLWLLLALVLAVEFRRQTADNPYRFLTRQEVAAFLDVRRPTPARHLLAIALTAGGGALAVLARDRFFATLDGAFRVLETLAETGTLGAFDTANLAWGVAFLVGVAAGSWGVDRLVVGLVREAQYRWRRRRSA